MNKLTLGLGAGALAMVAFGLSACGDEVTNITQVGIQQVAAGEKMGECNDKNVGEMIFVTDSAAVYYCDGSDWQTLNGKDGVDGKDGADGKDGENGANGSNGENGSSGSAGAGCSVEEIDNGYKIVCGGDSVGVVLNGEKGDKGDKGDQGEPGKDGADGKIVYGIPSVKYDCESGEYNCVTTAYLNPAVEYGELLDERDNRVYRTVQIGNQVWMAQNLAYEDTKNIALQGQMWCYYDSTAFCETYGRLYTWSAAMGIGSTYNTTLAGDLVAEQHQGICPEGWHIPSAAEWETLANYVDAHNGAEGVGTSLKSPHLFQARDSIPTGTDLFGFAGLPGDDRVDGQKSVKLGTTKGYDDYVGRLGHWWSSSETGASTTTRRDLRFNSEVLYVGSYGKAYGESVRCLKNSD